MTPRIKEELNESDFLSISQLLFAQANSGEISYNLNGNGELFSFVPPSILKITYVFEHLRSSLIYCPQSHGWNLNSFKTRFDAQAQFPDLKIYDGYPKDIFDFLGHPPDECLMDFKTLGTVHLSKNLSLLNHSMTLQLHDYVLPCWLDYALSPELWGPNGKWMRFHERLHTLFANNGLLIKQDVPGHYPLKKSCDWLTREGFVGKKTDETFELILGWDFPLSGLVKLEKLVGQES
jgi:hypothetical protein